MEIVGENIYLLGDRLVNFYLILEGGQVTLVDTGLPRSWPAVPSALHRLGLHLHDIAAVVLTHVHADHAGSAPAAHQTSGAPLRLHRAEMTVARGARPPRHERSLLGYLWRPTAIRNLVGLVRGGITRRLLLDGLEPVGDGDHLDIPGQPHVIHLPGHTQGSIGLHLPDRGTLFSGDALVTYNLLTGHHGPQLLPRAFTEDSTAAAASLDRIAALDADLLLPGHGRPLRAPMTTTVALAQAAGPS